MAASNPDSLADAGSVAPPEDTLDPTESSAAPAEAEAEAATDAEAEAATADATADATEATASPTLLQRFGAWRRGRPFLPGLFIILSGIVLMTPAYLSVKILDILVMISTISGVSTLVLGIILVLLGITTWTKPDTRLFTGVLAIVFGIVALPTSNFGGFFVGTLLALIGGSFALAWEPQDRPRKRKRRGQQPTAPVAVALLALTLGLVGAVGVGTPIALSQAQQPAFLPVPGSITGVVTADTVVVKGNVSVAVTTVQTQAGPTDVIELRGDNVTAKNLALHVPGTVREKVLRQQTTDDVVISGNAVLRVKVLTATPALVNVPTFPVTVDVTTPPGDILPKLGIPRIDAPDQIVDLVSLKNVRFEVVSLTSETLLAPKVLVV